MVRSSLVWSLSLGIWSLVAVTTAGCTGTPGAKEDSGRGSGSAAGEGDGAGGDGSEDADGDGSPAATDCDDNDSSVYPGATETCDGRDEDCDGEIDEDAADAATWYVDRDGDGAGDPSQSLLSCAAPSGHVESDTDCDDTDAAVAPGAEELAGDEVDQDCDGAELCFVDADGDGERPDTTATVASSDLDCQDSGEATAAQPTGDCDDTDPAVSTAATEGPGDGLDQDCDGSELCFVDADLDGHAADDGATAPSADLSCTGEGLLAASAPLDDCDDSDAGVHPGAAELPGDERDQDCDSAELCFVDADGDGERPDTTATVASGDLDCQDSGEADATAPAGDCDDADAAVHSGAVELAGDEVDQDCDGTELCYADLDEDGHGDVGLVEVSSVDVDCTGAGELGGSDPLDDCDDSDPTVNPSAAERVGDSVDQDCDGTELCYADSDGDGHAESTGTTVVSADIDCSGSGEASASADRDDCDDTEPTIHGGATEVAGDEVDQDCDGAELCYVDDDDDGHRPDASSTVASADLSCADAGEATASEPTGDCDDSDAAVSPAATETCNEIDDDCNGMTDDNAVDAVLTYTDGDSDGYGLSSSATLSCTVSSGSTTTLGDCDDSDAAIYPGALELCWDLIDDDCDGLTASDPDCAPVGTTWMADESIDQLATTAPARIRLAAVADLPSDVDAVDELAVGLPAAGTGSVLVFDGVFDGPSALTAADAATVLLGSSTGDEFGESIDFLGDFDGDGTSELLVGAPGVGSDRGAVYLFSLDSSFSTATGPTDAAWTFDTGASSDRVGDAVAALGDVDGDGLADLAFSAEGDDRGGSNAGAAWIVFGDSASGTVSTASQAVLVGEVAGDAVSAVGAAGDVDGDGYDDVLVGASENDDGGTRAGKAWLVLGPLSARRHELGAAALQIVGSDSSDGVGGRVAGVSDLDGDGRADLAVLAEGWDASATNNVGAVGVFLSPLAAGTLEFDDADHLVVGTAADELDGARWSAGDVDGDGWGDLLLGAPSADTTATNSGDAVLFYGPLTARELTLADGEARFPGAAGQKYGAEVLVADFGGDGFSDVFVAALDSTVFGAIEAVLGGTREEDRAPAVDTTTDDDGDGYTEDDGDCDDTSAARSPGLSETCGNAVDEDCDGQLDPCMPAASVSLLSLPTWVEAQTSSSLRYRDFGENVRVVGDINGDGLDDLAIGDTAYSSNTGRIEVFFGPIPPQSLEDRDADATITSSTSNARLGGSIALAGDLDGDGFSDLAVGGLTTTQVDIAVFRGGPEFSGGAVSSADWLFEGDVRLNLGSGATVGDIDGDGFDDFAVGAANADDGWSVNQGAVTLFYGPLPTGTYSVPSDGDTVIYGESYDDGVGLYMQGLGDLNQDGIGDLLVFSEDWDDHIAATGAHNAAVAVFYGPVSSGQELRTSNADAFLGTSTSYWTPVWAAGDLDGDGYTELVMEGGPASSDSSFAVLSLAGARGWVDEDELMVAVVDDDSAGLHFSYTGMAAGDFNRDGVDDLAVGGCDTSTLSGSAWLWLGPLSGALDAADADVTITGHSDYCMGNALSFGDLNGDGFEDLVLGVHDAGTSVYEPGAISVLPGGADSATLSLSALAALAPDPSVDADGDGWSIDAGDCHDDRADAYPGAPEDCADPVDLDCDGVRPICTATTDLDWPPPGSMSLGFGRSRTSTFIPFAAVGDVDGDGLDDVVVVDGRNQEAYVVAGRPTLGGIELDDHDLPLVEPSPTLGDVPSSAAGLDDMNGDGLPELLFSSQLGRAFLLPSSGALTTRDLDDASLLFSHTDSTAGFADRVLDAGDLDGDGVGSILVTAPTADGGATESGAVLLFPTSLSSGSHDETSAELVIQGASAGSELGTHALALGDLDGDGLDDLALSDLYTSGTKGSVYIWLGGASSGTVSISSADASVQTDISGFSNGARPFRIGDVDGDGHDDFAVGASISSAPSGGTGSVHLWSGGPATGASVLTGADMSIESDGSANRLGSAAASDIDFDHDGYTDLILGASPTSYSSTANSKVLAIYGPISIAGTLASSDADGTYASSYGLGYELETAGDVDGDGHTDIWSSLYTSVVLIRGGTR